MAKYDYSRFKIRIAPDSKKRQGLHMGDVVRRQYMDGARTLYSLMVVLSTGEDQVLLPDGKQASSPFFIGALIEGDEPHEGELLDFVRLTSLTDERRSGALYLTASDGESPYMDVIDGMGTERSLCRPSSLAGFGCRDSEAWTYRYTPSEGGAERTIRLTRTAASATTEAGLQIPFTVPVGHPQRLVISFRIRASKALESVPLHFGYADGTETDGSDTVDVTTAWQYRLSLITVDFPAEYLRVLTFDLAAYLSVGDWCEISDLNVCLLEHLSSFTDASKIRVGRITGVSDPLFGMLQGYGAYFQRLYATRDVNVAGTLTAGDEAGFGSTFYVGRIHKNCFVNSLEPAFYPAASVVTEPSPAGIGVCHRITADNVRIDCQSEAWTEAHAGQLYCFSFWIRREIATTLRVQYGTTLPQDLTIGREWTRLHIVLTIEHIPGSGMNITLTGAAGSLISSPQLEQGKIPTLYQATDGVLDDTEEYGAWFCRGGVGGTIQHPLLRLNEDGSISSADGSFVINRDGTGYFSGGRFRWDKDSITLQEVTIRWEDLDETTQQQMKPRFVTIEGGTVFHFPDELLGSLCDPAEILLTGTTHNFEPSSCLWEYLADDGQWKNAGGNTNSYVLTPDFHGWEGRDVLTLRLSALSDDTLYSGQHTVFKHYDGTDSYSLYVESEHGTVLRNGQGSTMLQARVYKGGTEVTERIPEERFRWSRSSRDAESDALWNVQEHRGRTLLVTDDDVWRQATFNCEVEIS